MVPRLRIRAYKLRWTRFAVTCLHRLIFLILLEPILKQAQKSPVRVVVNTLITFVLTAAVLYFLVVYPLNRLAERRKRGEEPPPEAPSEEVKLLTEIRDALVRQQVSPGAVNDILGRHQDPPQR